MNRWIGFILGALLALAPCSAPAQSAQPESRHWVREGDRITFTTARISLPNRAGATTLSRSAEFSHPGQGIDTGLQYLSSDQAVFATVYVYYPGLPHAGLSAFATDQAVRIRSGPQLREVSSGVTRAGGRDGAAIRTDYAGFLNDNSASSAAFIKAGRWIVKLRVSGPEGRRQDVERTMSALLDGIRFEGEIVPRMAEPLEISLCREQAGRDARLLPSSAAETADEAVIGILDGAGEEGREQGAAHRAGTPLVGAHWCSSRSPNPAVPILRAIDGGPADGNASVLVAIISDSGNWIEVVRRRSGGRYVVLHHEIGETRLLGAFDAVPSDSQIVAIATGADRENGRVRATVVHQSDGNSDVTVHVTPDKGATIPTT